jgi:hypothetical protein
MLTNRKTEAALALERAKKAVADSYVFSSVYNRLHASHDRLLMAAAAAVTDIDEYDQVTTTSHNALLDAIAAAEEPMK